MPTARCDGFQFHIDTVGVSFLFSHQGIFVVYLPNGVMFHCTVASSCPSNPAMMNRNGTIFEPVSAVRREGSGIPVISNWSTVNPLSLLELVLSVFLEPFRQLVVVVTVFVCSFPLWVSVLTTKP